MLDNTTSTSSSSIIWWEDKTIEWSDIVITPNLTMEWWEELED